MNQINKIKAITTKKDKLFLILLILMSILVSLIETIGITAVMPFISIASNPELILDNQYFKAIYIYLDFKTTIEFVVWFGVALISFYILRALYTGFY